jgi:transposase, IS30 family
VAACAAVGITRKTGYRWRAESGGLPPDRLGEIGRSGRYLLLLERQRIATLHRQGLNHRPRKRHGRAAANDTVVILRTDAAAALRRGFTDGARPRRGAVHPGRGVRGPRFGVVGLRRPPRLAVSARSTLDGKL